MGLLYHFPTDKSDTEHVNVNNTTLTLRSYGLPPIFWVYLIATLSAVFFLTFAVWPSVMKILESKELIDQFIGLGLLFTVFGSSLSFIALFFYEKNIIKNTSSIVLKHKLFFIPFINKNIPVNQDCEYEITGYLSSANMAKLSGVDSVI